jgi:hypothetical protein
MDVTRRTPIGVRLRRWRRAAGIIARVRPGFLSRILARFLARFLLRILPGVVAGWRTEIAARAEGRFADRTTRRTRARIEARLAGILLPIVVRWRAVLRQSRRSGEHQSSQGDANHAHQNLRQSSR